MCADDGDEVHCDGFSTSPDSGAEFWHERRQLSIWAEEIGRGQ